MARFQFRLPDIGEGIAEAEIVAWHVQPGDLVAEDQPVADMMTDKATVEMESPVAGTVIAVAGAVGDMIPIGSTLMVIETDAESATTDAGDTAPTPAPAASPPPPPATDATPNAPAPAPRYVPAPHPDATEIAVPMPSAPALASPAVRARARDLGIDLSQVKARDGGRIRHADLDAYLT
ncbi:MAG: hypothetical protein RIR59_733, partial [Pseudomonadota bacterium]